MSLTLPSLPHLFPPSTSALPIFPVASLSFDDNNDDVVVVVVVVVDDDGLLSSVSLEEREIRETNATFEAELTFKLP